MELYTHQPKEFIINLLKDEVIYTDISHLDNRPPYFKFAYNILLSYIDKDKRDLFTNYPIWCWYKNTTAIDNDGIRIELNVPDNLVILMDYYDWGGGALFYSEIFLNNLLSNSIEPGDFNKIKDNIKNSLNKDMMRNDIQAIIPYIKLDWVKNLNEVLSNI